MDLTYAVVALLVGWCGTPWPIRWPFPWHPIVKPEPPPCPVCGNLVSSVGGLIGGFLIVQILPNEVSLITISIGAFVIGRIAGDIYSYSLKNNDFNTKQID